MHGHLIENINEEPPAMLVDSFLKEASYNLLRAASSAIITTSLCNCKIEAGTSGVIGPLIVFAMASASFATTEHTIEKKNSQGLCPLLSES